MQRSSVLAGVLGPPQSRQPRQRESKGRGGRPGLVQSRWTEHTSRVAPPVVRAARDPWHRSRPVAPGSQIASGCRRRRCAPWHGRLVLSASPAEDDEDDRSYRHNRGERVERDIKSEMFGQECDGNGSHALATRPGRTGRVCPYFDSTGTGSTAASRWRRARKNSSTAGITEITMTARIMMWKLCCAPGTFLSA